MTMVRAAVTEKPGRIALHEFAMPDPEPGAVVMKVHYSGICGTDKHTFRGESKQYAGTPHERDLTYPLICGHENVGEVVALGGEVLDSEGQPLKIGDRIVPGANVACGACHFCRNDYPYYMCENLQDYGNSLHCGTAPHLFGGWAEHMYLLPGSKLFRVPDDLPDHVAVLTEIMSVTHGVETAQSLLGLIGGSRFGQTIAVLGVGPLGLCHLIKSRFLDCGELVAIDRFPSRLETASELGATLTLNAGELGDEELVARVREHTVRGADVVHDCSGVPQTFVNALKMVRPGGVVVESGAFVDLGPVEVNPNRDICTTNVTVIGVGGEKATAYASSMELLARNRDRLPLDRIVTHRMALEDAGDALELSQRDGAMKVVLDPLL